MSSSRVTRLAIANFLAALGVVILLGLINVGGALALGVGILFTFPYTLLVWSAGYQLIAGSEPPVKP